MQKTDLLQYIETSIQKVHSINEMSKSFSPDDNFYANINATLKYLQSVLHDLKDNTLPTHFYQKIYHNTELPYVNKIKNEISKTFNDIERHKATNKLNNYFLINIGIELNSTYQVYKSLNFSANNTVIVGANGCGKSTLASLLQNALDERVGIIISAQKLLIIPTFDNIPNLNSSNEKYNNYQKRNNNGKVTYKSSENFYADEYADEYKILLSQLLAERISKRNQYLDQISEGNPINKKEFQSNLDIALDIWNSLIEHRQIFCNEENNLYIKTLDSNNTAYPAHNMSDGEKVILFLIGRVLLAPKDALIITDEPEMYLHKAIINKLWDKLESERTDCTFIYLTHDLDFAASRNADKFWIKEFKYPYEWIIDKITDNEIPQELLMKLLGSRKKILFCEGKKNSLDAPIFEILFPDYTITPLQSCKEVINYTRSYNKISNKNTTAFGIIDQDFRSEEQVNKLKSENIFSFSVAEIENLFLLEDFILKFAEYKNEKINIETIKSKVLGSLKKDREIQISNFVSSYINYIFTESHIKNGNTKTDIISNYQEFTNNIDIDQLYEERKILIDEIISTSDYPKTLIVYNNKGLHKIIEEAFNYKSSSYRNKALTFLQQNKDAQQILKSMFPQELLSN